MGAECSPSVESLSLFSGLCVTEGWAVLWAGCDRGLFSGLGVTEGWAVLWAVVQRCPGHHSSSVECLIKQGWRERSEDGPWRGWRIREGMEIRAWLLTKLQHLTGYPLNFMNFERWNYTWEKVHTQIQTAARPHTHTCHPSSFGCLDTECCAVSERFGNSHKLFNSLRNGCTHPPIYPSIHPIPISMSI